MWRELIGRLYSDAEFAAPATDADIDRIERRLGRKVPDELREVLRETDGARGEHGSGLVWPVREIVDQNTEFRQNTDITELYKPFDQLMFVGDNGGGDQFAYLLAAGERSGGVFAWDHETDERIWIADSLRDYLESRASADGDDWYK